MVDVLEVRTGCPLSCCPPGRSCRVSVVLSPVSGGFVLDCGWLHDRLAASGLVAGDLPSGEEISERLVAGGGVALSVTGGELQVTLEGTSPPRRWHRDGSVLRGSLLSDTTTGACIVIRPAGEGPHTDAVARLQAAFGEPWRRLPVRPAPAG